LGRWILFAQFGKNNRVEQNQEKSTSRGVRERRSNAPPSFGTASR
jgi:hypothetical protein